ncbi:MAG: hypothetical protein AAF629_30335 [Chloroflexota bacterium]
MDKETLQIYLANNWSKLMTQLEGVPHDDFETYPPDGDWSVKEICAFLTAWDGEALRRLDFYTGQTFTPPHDLQDADYWQQWGADQVKIKAIMSAQGVLIDMIGTRQRLLSRLEDVPDFYVERWLADDPHALQPYFDAYFNQVKQWREAWNEAHPPARGIKRIWQKLRSPKP